MSGYAIHVYCLYVYDIFRFITKNLNSMSLLILTYVNKFAQDYITGFLGASPSRRREVYIVLTCGLANLSILEKIT